MNVKVFDKLYWHDSLAQVCQVQHTRTQPMWIKSSLECSYTSYSYIHIKTHGRVSVAKEDKRRTLLGRAFFYTKGVLDETYITHTITCMP